NLRESDLSDQFPQAADDADRTRLRAACSSHRRIREGVCATRSSALLQLFALPQFVARLASIRSARLLPSQAFEADSKPTLWRSCAASHLGGRDRNGKGGDRLGGRRVREADIDTPRLVPFRSQNVQATNADNLVVLRLDVMLVPRQCFLPLLRLDLILGTLIVEAR